MSQERVDLSVDIVNDAIAKSFSGESPLPFDPTSGYEGAIAAGATKEEAIRIAQELGSAPVSDSGARMGAMAILNSKEGLN